MLVISIASTQTGVTPTPAKMEASYPLGQQVATYPYCMIPRDQRVFSQDVGDRKLTLILHLQAPVTTTNFPADVSLRSSPGLNIGRHS